MASTMHLTAPAPPLSDLALRFMVAMPGLEQHTRYTLTPIDDAPVYWLTAEGEPPVALPVADAFAIDPAYSLDLSDADAAALGITHAGDALVLIVLTIATDEPSITANLLAPVVVNRRNGAARQIILESSGRALRHPVILIHQREAEAAPEPSP